MCSHVTELSGREIFIYICRFEIDGAFKTIFYYLLCKVFGKHCTCKQLKEVHRSKPHRSRRLNHRVHTEWQWPISGIHHHHEGKISPGWWGGGCTPSPFHGVNHHVESCRERFSWEGRYTPPPSFLLYPHKYSVGWTSSALSLSIYPYIYLNAYTRG